MSIDSNRVEEIFEEAVDLSAGDRAAYIDEACGDDEALKQMVLALLKHVDDDEEDSGFCIESESPDELIGTSIDNYTLRSVLGEGGFGVVYLADQVEPVQRRVAVKVIKPGMDTKAVVARFEAERQALALMDHPNVARILDGGTTQLGRPYFVMELVKGVSITEFCDTNRLKIRDRIDLFRMACDSIQHAHTKGVIHRDIKPNNILVSYEDGKPSVKVIDFGIAKALDRQLTEQTVFTESGQFVGTPEYMSPEQAQMTSLDIDTRTDVYALGVLLYELLTGQLPFDKKTLRAAALGEIQRIIREETPAKPSTRCNSMVSSASKEAGAIAHARQLDLSTLPRRLRGDLDWIVMQCLEKDRSRRYDTASALAADLGRHLAHEPVDAGPPSAVYRFKKFAKRKSGLLVACALIALALIGGIAASSYFAIEATRQRDVAIKNQERAEVVKELLTEAIASVDPAVAGGLDKELMTTVLKNLSENMSSGFGTDSAIEAELVRTLGQAYESLGLLTQAALHYERSVQVHKDVFGDDSRETVNAVQDLGSAYRKLGDLDKALPLHLEALSWRRENLGRHHIETLASVGNTGVAYMQMGDYEEARRLLEEDLNSSKEVLGELDQRTVNAKNNMAMLLVKSGEHSVAEQMWQEVLDARIDFYGRDHPKTIDSLSNMGFILIVRTRPNKAVPYCREAMERARVVLGDSHPKTLLAMSAMARALMGRQRGPASLDVWSPGHEVTQSAIAEAEELLFEVLQKRAQVLGKDHPSYFVSLTNLGDIKYFQGDYEAARDYFSQAIEAKTRVLGPTHLSTLYSTSSLGIIYSSLGESDKAFNLWRQALDGFVEAVGINHQGTIDVVELLIELSTELNSLEEAQKYRAMLPTLGATADEPIDEPASNPG